MRRSVKTPLTASRATKRGRPSTDMARSVRNAHAIGRQTPQQVPNRRERKAPGLIWLALEAEANAQWKP